MNGWEWLIVAVVGMVLAAIVAQLWRDHAETKLKADLEHEVTLARIEQEMFERSLATPVSAFHTRPRIPDLVGRSHLQRPTQTRTPQSAGGGMLATRVAGPDDKPPPPPSPEAQDSARPPA